MKRDEIRQLARIGLQLGMLMIWKIISHYDERHDSRGYFYRFVRNFFGAGRATRPRLEPTGSVEAVKRSVRANPQGIGVLSTYSVAEELEAGSVRQLRIRPRPSVSRYCCIERAIRYIRLQLTCWKRFVQF